MSSESPGDQQASPTPVATDDLLPPVKPPSATFLIQLFLIPGVIVLVIVLLWTLLSGVVFRRSDPRELIKSLEGSSATRWQKAQELADVLRTSGDQYTRFKHDANAARQLATVLQREVQGGPPVGQFQQEEKMFRFFLSRCLGFFYVDDGLPVLLEVAGTERNEAEQIVRRGAIQGIAQLSDNMQQEDVAWPASRPEVETALVELAKDEHAPIRSDAAFALGVLGTAGALQQLHDMLDDASPEARYNAAVALANRGDARSVGVLAEMLDYEEDAGLRKEEPQFRRGKRYRVMVNALGAAAKLKEKSPTADLSELLEVLDALLKADPATLEKHFVVREVVSDVQATLPSLRD